MDYRIGDVVMSVAGHDRGTCYAVVKTEGGMLLLANGKTRSADIPKKKKPRHVKKISSLQEEISLELERRCGRFSKESGTADSSLRSALKESGYDNSNIMIKRYFDE